VNPSLQTTLRDTIAHALRTEGCYVGEIDSATTQADVDAQWAAHLAARLVGMRVTVAVSHEHQPGRPARAVLHVTQRSR
jgi:hypothetical protein